MKWMELIRVRSSEAALRDAVPALRSQLREIEGSIPGAETFILQHALYDGDVSVVVVWRTEIEPGKSREGLMVAEQLEKLGPVDHAVWLPAEVETEKRMETRL